jgi:urease alpha subunit
VDNQRSDPDRVPTVTATVGTLPKVNNKTTSSTPEKLDKTLLKFINFDELYIHVKQQLSTGKISLSIRNMRKIVHQHLKRNPSLAKVSVSITSSNYLVDKIRDKMLDTQFILKNPNYSKGKVKYLLARPISSDSLSNSSTSNIAAT